MKSFSVGFQIKGWTHRGGGEGADLLLSMDLYKALCPSVSPTFVFDLVLIFSSLLTPSQILASSSALVVIILDKNNSSSNVQRNSS